MEKEFWAKRKVLNVLDRVEVKLSRKLDKAETCNEIASLTAQIEDIQELRDKVNKPGVLKSKEFWVEVLKIVGVGVALGVVIWYDCSGHVLPKSLEKWIPGPRL